VVGPVFLGGDAGIPKPPTPDDGSGLCSISGCPRISRAAQDFCWCHGGRRSTVGALPWRLALPHEQWLASSPRGIIRM
jgi:hypothetical protein